jgi:molybdopterin-containing oxidoreductase family iron-sulfur binding subunit
MSKRAPHPSLPAHIDAQPEFPKGHVDTPPDEDAVYLSRRGLMGAMAATFALVGAEGCRRPVEKVVPYGKMPEDVIPGIPSHYATVLQRRGDAIGLIVESHEGRPTKIEGNEGHPSSFGGADMVAQASILELYDPERSTTPRKGGVVAGWSAFDAELSAKLATYDKDQGARLRLLMPPTLSPTLVRMRGALAQRFPKARVHTWSAVAESNVREGARIAFGKPMIPVNLYDRAKLVLSLDCDFLQTESGAIRAAKGFAASRRLRSARETMNRLYVVEPARTATGNIADHRLRLAASDVEKYAYALAAELIKQGVNLGTDLTASVTKRASAQGFSAKWLGVVAKELTSNRGRSLVVVGARQPAVVHALAHAINAGIGAVGATVTYAPVADPDEIDVTVDIKALADAIASKQVDGLVILGGNPVYDAPGDLSFGDKLASVPFSVHASLFVDETSDKCTWHVPRAHEFECWGDLQSLDGTVAVQQPLIAPLYAGRSDLELLAQLANGPERSAFDAVRNTANGLLLSARQLFACGIPDAMGRLMCSDAAGNAIPVHLNDLDREWSRALSAGVLQRAPARQVSAAAANAAIAAAIEAHKVPARGAGPFEATFAPCPKMVDGRYANNTWLQEVPDSSTKLVWDNAAILSPASAKELGVDRRDMVKISAGERSVTAAVWIVPGQADHSVALSLGWGRTKAGRIGNGKGFNFYPLRTTDAQGFAQGVSISKTGDEPYFFAQTQENDSTEGRPIAHEATLAEYQKSPNFSEIDAPPPRSLPLWEQVDYSKGHQWGMAIDLNACTGCNACVVACFSENNIPVVGKREVWRGREMHWLRIDRYYVEHTEGASAEEPAVIYQPLACVHCEEAPCENVCPVNATQHGPEGLNEMAYNRCIGTRYCANNCPYKVRRFNYLNWHNDVVWKETGGLPETLAMQQNPNVTVRFRGVMEKCTYCIQRIQSTKIKAKREYRQIRDGELRTACQQTCPSDAIVFGDINDPNTAVSRAVRIDRRFGLLAELGTRPRTTYLGKVRNPNPEMA